MLSDGSDSNKQREGGIALAGALILSVGLVAYSAFFGSPDIEESTSMSYSAGAQYSNGIQIPDANVYGIHTVLGVPVFDTLQGTGDRLPYQASWAQSVTWPLRFIVSWNHLASVRTFVFSVLSLFLVFVSVLSWLPQARLRKLLLIGLLSSTSFGLYVRHNEWTDTYVQTIGIFAVVFYFCHKDFFVESAPHAYLYRTAPLLALFVVLNGFITGHPGVWPVGIVIMVSVFVVFATERTFRRNLVGWCRQHALILGCLLAASLLTVATVSSDMIFELRGQSWGEDRLAQTQGLFGELAFGGLPEGGIASLVMRVASIIFASAMMPLFLFFYEWLPSSLRIARFPEVVRIEFAGSLVIVAFVIGLQKISDTRVRCFVTKLLWAQLLIWLFALASTYDVMPTAFAASGVWMAIPIILNVNVVISFLLLSNWGRRAVVSRVITLLNVTMVGIWCLIQFGVTTYESSITWPERYSSWFHDSRSLSESQITQSESGTAGRAVLSRRAFTDLLGLVAAGVPVVAPSDPKIRNSEHLKSTFSFNYSVDPIAISRLVTESGERTLDFLQVEKVIVGAPLDETDSALLRSAADAHGWRQIVPDDAFVSFYLDQVTVFERRSFSTFVLSDTNSAAVPKCPVLERDCPIVTVSQIAEVSRQPNLRLCDSECLWRFDAPQTSAGSVLLVPITFDNSLVAQNTRGDRNITIRDAGGFVGIVVEDDQQPTTYTFQLKPDNRMLGRVASSYANLLFVVAFLGVTAWRRATRHRASSVYRSTIQSR